MPNTKYNIQSPSNTKAGNRKFKIQQRNDVQSRKPQGTKQRLRELAKEERMELMLLMVGNNGFEQIIPQRSTGTTKEGRFTVAPLNVFFSGYLKGPVWKIISE